MSPPLSRRQIWIHLMLYPGHTLPTAAAPIAVAIGLAIHDGVFALWPALTAFVCSWLVHVGGVFVDVYKLLLNHPTVHEHPELNEAVAHGWLRLPMLRLAAIAWFLVALVPGIYLYAVVGPPSLILGGVGIVAAAWYNAGPRSMAELGLADPVFFVMFAFVAVAATYYVQAVACHATVTLPPMALLVGVPIGALVVNVLVIDDIRDVEFDRQKGWRTTPVRFGVAWSRREHLVLTVVAYAMPLGFAWHFGPWLLLPLITLPLAIAAERAVWTAPTREALFPWTPRSAFLSMIYGFLLGLGLAMSHGTSTAVLHDV
ncbi:MAG: UbiA family prenyltransferase [Kofleriaceae bacterium]